MITINSKSQPSKGGDDLLIEKLDKAYKQNIPSKESLLILSHLPSLQLGNEKGHLGRKISLPSKNDGNSFGQTATAMSHWDSPIINWLAGTIGALLMVFTFFLYQSIAPHKGDKDSKTAGDTLESLKRELSYINRLAKATDSKKTIELDYKGNSSFTYQLIYLAKEDGVWIGKISKKMQLTHSASISLKEKLPLYIETCTVDISGEICRVDMLDSDDNNWRIKVE